MGSTIFVIDSSPAVRRMVEQTSSPAGYSVVGFPDGPSALEAARKASPALILADFHLENMTFSGFCKEIGRQDHLAETLIVSIMDGSDRLDENKLRALGVRAFLKKPFHSEQLLETIHGILKTPAGRPDGRTSMKARTWPPVTVATDDECNDSPRSAVVDDSVHVETEKEQTTMPPAPLPSPVLPTSAGVAPTLADGEAMMKGLFDHFLQSVTLHAERTIHGFVPQAITQEVAGQVGTAVRAAVQAEVTKQLVEALAPERLLIAMRDLIQEELGRCTPAHLAGVETTVRQAVADVAPAILEQSVEKQLGNLTETEVKKRLPEVLQAQMGTIDRLVEKEIERVAAQCARRAADDIIPEMAKDPIQQAVQRIVPEVAESQVRAEIMRLSSAG